MLSTCRRPTFASANDQLMIKIRGLTVHDARQKAVQHLPDETGNMAASIYKPSRDMGDCRGGNLGVSAIHTANSWESST